MKREAVMRARNVVVGGLAAGAMLVAASLGASANVIFCMSDPPVQVVTPGGHNLTVNNQVYLPAAAVRLKNNVTDDAGARPDGHGGTLITVHVYVPAPAHVVASVNRYQVTAASSGAGIVTLYLDVPIS
jgi:hypothetical protein